MSLSHADAYKDGCAIWPSNSFCGDKRTELAKYFEHGGICHLVEMPVQRFSSASFAA